MIPIDLYFCFMFSLNISSWSKVSSNGSGVGSRSLAFKQFDPSDIIITALYMLELTFHCTGLLWTDLLIVITFTKQYA